MSPHSLTFPARIGRVLPLRAGVLIPKDAESDFDRDDS